MKTEILFGILVTLLNKGRTKASSLAEKFEISTKTVQRYLSYLESSGIPTISYFGKDGGTEVLGSFSLCSCRFSDEEIAKLLCLLEDSPDINHKVLKTKEKLLVQLNSQKKQEIQGLENSLIYDFAPWGSEPTTPNFYEEIASAIKNKQVLDITYQKGNEEISKRAISPIALIIKATSMYTYAYCHTKQENRFFKLSRIKSLSISSEKYNAKPISKEELKFQIQNCFDTIELTIELPKSRQNDAVEWIKPIKTTVSKNNVCIVGKATNNNGLLHKLMSYENQIKVIEPEWLKNNLIDMCQKIATNYN